LGIVEVDMLVFDGRPLAVSVGNTQGWLQL
jgi:hypothetical protein